MKAKKLAVCSCLLLVISLILGWQYISVRVERDFLQMNIDAQFSYNFSSLYENLFQHSDPFSDQDKISKLSVNAQFCRSLFVCTTFSKNIAVQNIVLSMAGMVPPNSEYQLITDRELIADIGYLLQNLNEPDSGKIADGIWSRLSNELQKQE